MRIAHYVVPFSTLIFTCAIQSAVAADYMLTPTQEDQQWLLPKVVPSPADNPTTPEKVALGKSLFFDPRLSSAGNVSCASCHIPQFGWTDGLKTSKGINNKDLGRATPTVINTGYNSIQYWDGRRPTLETQALGPMLNSDLMALDLTLLVKWLNEEPTYKAWFAKAYPNEVIDKITVAKALAAFERTVVSDNSPFDQWLRGNKKAMTKEQIIGFRLFTDPNKGNCAACHQAPNFTDNGFHNVGLASHDRPTPDLGRFTQKPVASLRGAFKTPTLRDVTLTAPYFHDGSAKTLMDVVDHYNNGGVTKTDLSPTVKPLNLSADEKKALVAFMQALTTDHMPLVLPNLPPPI